MFGHARTLLLLVITVSTQLLLNLQYRGFPENTKKSHAQLFLLDNTLWLKGYASVMPMFSLLFQVDKTPYTENMAQLWPTRIRFLQLVNQTLRTGTCTVFPTQSNKTNIGPCQAHPYICEVRPIFAQCVRHAGHSHWQNIKHIKAAKDKEKAAAASAITRKLKLAIKDGGGSTNPKLNSRLNKALEEGKSKGVPAATMNETLKRIEKHSINANTLTIEMKAMGNLWMVVEALTPNPVQLKNDIRNILKKFGGSIGDRKGFSAHAFNRRGMIYLPLEIDGTPLSEDEALELAIEAGAEEVQQGVDEDGLEAHVLFCDPDDFLNVRKNLEQQDVYMSDAKIEYIPHSPIVLKSDDEIYNVNRMMNYFSLMEDISHVYVNFVIEEKS